MAGKSPGTQVWVDLSRSGKRAFCSYFLPNLVTLYLHRRTGRKMPELTWNTVKAFFSMAETYRVPPFLFSFLPLSLQFFFFLPSSHPPSIPPSSHFLPLPSPLPFCVCVQECSRYRKGCGKQRQLNCSVCFT